MANPGNQYNPGMMSQQSSGVPYSSAGMMSASQQSMMSGSQPGINVSSQQGMVGQGQQGMMVSGQHGMMGSSQSHMVSGQQGMMGSSQQGMMGSQQSMVGSGQQSVMGGGGGGSQQSMASGSQQSMMAGHSQGVVGSGGQSQIANQLAGAGQTEPNAITMCKRGQECVQDIVTKVTDIFKFLQTKTNPLPNGVNTNALQDRRNKLNEYLEQLSILFRMLRAFYNKVNEVCPEEPSEEALVPFVGQPFEDVLSPSADHLKSRIFMEEKRELVEQLMLKNRQLKAIIDQMRTIVWEINTMIVMRKS